MPASLILCMAGRNTRFHDVGFDIPKYLLPWKNEVIITSILREIISQYNFRDILLLANKRDIHFKNNLISALNVIGLNDKNVYYIGDTDGQAHTAMLGVDLIKDKSSCVMIHNADTLIINRNFNMIENMLSTNDAYVDVFVANSPSYCYVRANGNNVIDIIEKKCISPYASSGLYAFKSPQTYIKAFSSTIDIFKKKELYISDVLKQLIADGGHVLINDLEHMSETCVLGTPYEYGLAFAKTRLER